MEGSQSQLSPDAATDIRLQNLWYAQNAGKEVAQRYVDAFDDCRRHLEMNPSIGSACKFRHRRLSGLRKLSFSGRFHVHLAFYRIEGGVIDIVRVMHGNRDLARRLAQPPGTEN